jgi:hypothetical protein
MPIRRAGFADFGPFADARVDCVDGLNVFIGENSTGKSHAMKAIYAVLEALRRAKAGNAKSVAAALEEKLAGVFRPDEDAVSRLIRRASSGTVAELSLESTKHARCTIGISAQGQVSVSKAWGPKRAVYLPTREILSMYPGFVSLYREREISFDETYYDACIALGAPRLRGAPRSGPETLAKMLRDALGGHTVFTGDRFYVKFMGDRARMEAHLVAEGLRKIATLERLVVNGSLMRQGYFFWDEPEANLNPKLTAVVAEGLRELAANGVQVFVTTHDYLLTKQLDLLSATARNPPTRFFLFRRPVRGSPVEVTHADRLSELSDNPIAEQFVRLYELKLDVEKDGRE